MPPLKPKEPMPRKKKPGRLAVRKYFVVGSGNKLRGDLGGFTCQIVDGDGASVGSPFTTDSHGHAPSAEIPTGSYKLTELPPQPRQPSIQLMAPG